MFATNEEMETPYMATYSLLVHKCVDPIIDQLSEMLQGETIIVFTVQPTEYHDGGSSQVDPSHHQHTEFYDGDFVHLSHHQSSSHNQPIEFHYRDYVHPSPHHSLLYMLKQRINTLLNRLTLIKTFRKSSGR